MYRSPSSVFLFFVSSTVALLQIHACPPPPSPLPLHPFLPAPSLPAPWSLPAPVAPVSCGLFLLRLWPCRLWTVGVLRDAFASRSTSLASRLSPYGSAIRSPGLAWVVLLVGGIASLSLLQCGSQGRTRESEPRERRVHREKECRSTGERTLVPRTAINSALPTRRTAINSVLELPSTAYWKRAVDGSSGESYGPLRACTAYDANTHTHTHIGQAPAQMHAICRAIR
eukprot:311882-Rhodomonas_salina.2